ncbi:GNAT family N-acetyltransferase [Cryptosporangium sp. NPDC051539]|uniref:GNAT family N-acetyltransferase n=1 Tax=Cryptosporangium sp. NPDC051539 TaxID=3363962 RepID=UPI00379267D4
MKTRTHPGGQLTGGGAQSDPPSLASLSVRPFRTKDLPAVFRVESQVHGNAVLPRFVFAQFFDMVGPGFQVAVLNGKVVGYVVVVRKDDHTRPTVLLDAVLPITGSEHVLKQLTETATAAAAKAFPVCLSDTPQGPATTRPPKYRVRRFRVEDVDRLFEVELSAFGDEPYPPRLFRALEILGDGFFVAEHRREDGTLEVVGYLAAFRDANDRKVGWVMSLAVHKDHQDHGVGSRLMAAAETYFAENRCREVMLTVDPENGAALHLYQKRHYTMVEKHTDHRGLKLPRLLMSWHSYVEPTEKNLTALSDAQVAEAAQAYARHALSRPAGSDDHPVVALP